MSTNGRAPSEQTELDGSIGANGQLTAAYGDLGAQGMVEIQRARMLVAMVEECAEHGPSNVTVAGVLERAGVSRRTFYEIFDDCEDCLLAALEDGLRRVSVRVLPAYQDGGRWLDRVRASLVALLEFLEAEPVMGRLLIVGSLGAGPGVLERRRCVLARIITVVDEGRLESKTGKQLQLLTAEGIVGGILSILHARLLASPSVSPTRGSARRFPSSAPSERDSLLELAGSLMGMIVLPYLGPTAANRELQRPIPKRAHTNARIAGEPLRNLGLRLTYRTVRALVSVAEHPGSSNREIGQAAGITDQGQMSKLLWRLERSGLVQNTGLGPGTGAPNVWTLTSRGEAINAAITTKETVAQ